jgi:hypothetical protein
MQMYYMSRALRPILLAPLLAGAWFSVHLSRADQQFQQHTPESVARAVEMEPRNTEYLALRAIQLDYNGDDSTALLTRAAELSPLNSAPRIRLGLAAEIRGDFAIAERWLLDAVRVDRQFEPRWALANFYFRQQNTERFWSAIRDALDTSYGDRRPAFDLCWRMGDASSLSATTILSRAIPQRREVVAAYLSYLLDSHRESVGPAAMKLAHFGDASDRELLLFACDVLIAANDAASARELWKSLGYSQPTGIFNGNFATTPVNHGFDWRSTETTGVTQMPIEQPQRARRIAFDGRQPESCALLSEMLLLGPHARYTLHWEARTTGLPSPSGIEWRIGDQRMAVEGKSATFLAAEELASLILFYQRPIGQARAEGSIEISGVAIEKLP